MRSSRRCSATRTKKVLATFFGTFLIGCTFLLMAALPGGAGAYIVLNNGLAPPNPANVIDDGIYSGDYVLVRNVGCPPSGHETNPCPSPGDPTEVELTIGGAVKYLYPRDTSTVTMNGGTVDSLWAQDFSTITMNGGTVAWDLGAYDSSTITMNGGTVLAGLVTHDSGALIEIVGSDFAVDGVPVPYGDLSAQTGILTGTLALGGVLNNDFRHGGYGGWAWGTITLSVIPEPTSILLQLTALLTLAGLRRHTPRH